MNGSKVLNVKSFQVAATSYLLKRFGLSREYSIPREYDRIVYPETKVTLNRAVFLDGQIEKINGAAFGKIEDIIDFVLGGTQVAGPILSKKFNNCYVMKNSLYSNLRKMRFTVARDIPRIKFEEDIDICMPSSFWGCSYFGHWLRDDCATHLLAGEEGEIRAMPTPDWADRPVYEALFEQNWPSAANGFYRSITLYHDIGVNAHKVDRFRELRARVRRNLSSGDRRIVYIRRGRSGTRRALRNEDAVIEYLRGFGAHIHEAEQDDASKLLGTCLDTDIVISVEGSQLSHALYLLRDGGGVLALQPPDRFFVSHADWAGQLGMRFAFVVGDPAEGGFTIDLGDLARTIDLLAAEIDARAA